MPDAEKRLLALLDRRVFDPAIDARPDDFPAERRAELERVRRAVRNTKNAYHRYGSARDVRRIFEKDLRSAHGAKQTKLLRDLDLPAFPDVADEFKRLADKSGVK